MQEILKMNEGPFIGGAKPCIADLAFLGQLVMVMCKCPDSYVAKNDGVKNYFAALKKALPKYDVYMKEAETYFSKKP